MAQTVLLNARVAPDLKAQAQAVLDEMGLNMSDAIRMFLTRIVAEKAIPFDVRVPNAVTIQALEDARNGIGMSAKFNTVGEMMAALHADMAAIDDED